MLKHIFNIKKRLVLLAFFYVLAGCDNQVERQTIVVQGPTMGTTYSVKVIDLDQGVDEIELAKKLDTLLKEFNLSMSTYIPSSELSRFNRSEVNEWFTISDDFCRVVELSRGVSLASGGGFDITVGPLVNLWGFGPEDSRGPPDDEAVKSVMENVGYDNLQSDCEKSLIKKSKPVYVDLSAVAKGFATGVVARKLKALGYDDFMVEIGGELYLSGLNAANQPWQIAIEKPEFGQEGALQILALSNVGVATSGDYRNFYEVEGRRISHTIDPKTGAPITHNLASVTVVMESGGAADAWATAFEVLGPDEGFDLAQAEGLAAYFIVREDGDYAVKYTTEFTKYLVVP